MALSLSTLLKGLAGVGWTDAATQDGPLDPSTLINDLGAIANGIDASLPSGDQLTTNVVVGGGGPGHQTITGGAGDDTLDGGADADTMTGGGGSDVYYVDATGDTVTEAANGGIDTVITLVTYTIPTQAEALYVVGSGLTGTGSAGNDILLSDFAANTLVGLGGDDLYLVRHTGDTVVEAANGGTDIVLANCNYTLPANVEALFMIGTGVTGTGTAGADLLLSAGGVNTLVGLGGNDVYYVNSTGDTVTEAANGGTDTVIALDDYTMPANVEALYMLGTGLTGTGSANADILLSDAGPLAGNGGFNTLVGLGGDDLYYVRQTGDIVTEAANGGHDTVVATVNFTMPANVETLYMVGTGLTGTGTAADETLVTIGANTLTGGGGNDTFRFTAGHTDGATISDFNGNGAAAGDTIVLAGYGAGATFTNVDATHWQVTYNGGAAHDVITFTNSATIDQTDFVLI